MSYQAGEISLIELLNNEIATLYMSEQCSDITLYIEGQKIPAHRSIIGARCEYLKTYFSNGLNEPNQTKFDLHVPLEAFQVLLKYFYTGQMSLSKIKELETLIQILNLVEEYCLFYLKTYFENYFKQIITVENTCRLLEVAKTYELKELEIKSLNFIDTNANQMLASESFKKIHKDLLESILTRDTFKASSELSIFRAIVEWSKHANQNIESVIHLVKLPLIPLEELLKIRNSGTLTSDKIFDAIQKQMTTKSTPRSHIQRFGYLPEQNENVASSKYNVLIKYNNFCFYQTYAGKTYKTSYTNFRYRRRIDDGSYRIIIELGEFFIINHLKIKLDSLSGYFIEISTDQKKWERIIDYSSFISLFMQNLYFPSRPVKYVKIGTPPPNIVFRLTEFEAYYRENIPEIRNGIVVPNKAVDYNIFGSGIIHLNQPYYIGSIRFYIAKQHPNRKYKFYIETWLNVEDCEDREKVADKSDEFVNGWQTFRFTSRTIVHIRVTPTACNIDGALRDFCIENFECPSSVN